MPDKKKRGDTDPTEKTCIVCGKTFITIRPNRKLCSEECCRARRENFYMRNRALRIERSKLWHKTHYSYTPQAKCLICGGTVKNGFNAIHRQRQRIHTECIIKDSLETLRNGKELQLYQKERLWSRGYGLKYIEKILQFQSGDITVAEDIYDEHRNL